MARSGANFTVGDVFVRSAAIFWRHAVPFILVGGLLTLPYVFVLYGHIDYTLPGYETVAAKNRWLAGFLKSSGALAFVLQNFSGAVILSAAFEAIRDRRVRIGDALRVGLTRLPWFIVVNTGVSLGYTIAYYLLLTGEGLTARMIGAAVLVPGMVIAIVGSAASAACIIERLDPIRSLGRSVTLTKGYRWILFGLIVLFALITISVNVMVILIYHFVQNRVALMIAYYLLYGSYVAYDTIAGVVVYRYLRLAKEGAEPEAITAVFE